MYGYRNNEARSQINCCRGNAINITQLCVCERACACLHPSAWACACACVHVAVFIQHATCVCRVVTSFVAPLVSPYFSTLSHKR